MERSFGERKTWYYVAFFKYYYFFTEFQECYAVSVFVKNNAPTLWAKALGTFLTGRERKEPGAANKIGPSTFLNGRVRKVLNTFHPRD